MFSLRACDRSEVWMMPIWVNVKGVSLKHFSGRHIHTSNRSQARKLDCSEPRPKFCARVRDSCHKLEKFRILASEWIFTLKGKITSFNLKSRVFTLTLKGKILFFTSGRWFNCVPSSSRLRVVPGFFLYGGQGREVNFFEISDEDEI